MWLWLFKVTTHPEVLVSHVNARTTPVGRKLLVERVRGQGWAVAHAAKAMGISRQCAHRWLSRYDQAGLAGLEDRSSRPRSSPTRTSARVEAQIVAARRQHRRGQDWLAAELGVSARTVGRVLRRHQMPYLAWLDPITGVLIRASKTSGVRYEMTTPGELVHVDVKKLGKIPDGGGWRLNGRAAHPGQSHKKVRIGYDFVHSIVDDYSRLAYSEIHDDEKATTCAGFLARAAAYFAAHGITSITAVMTDNAMAYRKSAVFAAAVGALGATQRFTKPHSPWQNGKVERYNRTLASEWAYARPYATNQARRDALDPWLNAYNTDRRHSALGGLPPTSRLSPTS